MTKQMYRNLIEIAYFLAGIIIGYTLALAIMLVIKW
jgi:hypothetical protein